jgi:hypothetical protein
MATSNSTSIYTNLTDVTCRNVFLTIVCCSGGMSDSSNRNTPFYRSHAIHYRKEAEVAEAPELAELLRRLADAYERVDAKQTEGRRLHPT